MDEEDEEEEAAVTRFAPPPRVALASWATSADGGSDLSDDDDDGIRGATAFKQLCASLGDPFLLLPSWAPLQPDGEATDDGDGGTGEVGRAIECGASMGHAG